MDKLALLIACAVLPEGCDPKPVGEIPALSGRKQASSAERDIPGGKTLAAALALLDPRVADPADLDQRRAQFQQKLAVLVPDKKVRTELGFSRVIRWHRLFTRRLSERQRDIRAHRDRLETLLRPEKGQQVRVDPGGTARVCATTGADPSCKMVPGFDQIDHEVATMNDGLRGLVEAEWYLVTHIDRLRAALDPDAATRGPADPATQ